MPHSVPTLAPLPRNTHSRTQPSATFVLWLLSSFLSNSLFQTCNTSVYYAPERQNHHRLELSLPGIGTPLPTPPATLNSLHTATGTIEGTASYSLILCSEPHLQPSTLSYIRKPRSDPPINPSLATVSAKASAYLIVDLQQLHSFYNSDLLMIISCKFSLPVYTFLSRMRSSLFQRLVTLDKGLLKPETSTLNGNVLLSDTLYILCIITPTAI